MKHVIKIEPTPLEPQPMEPNIPKTFVKAKANTFRQTVAMKRSNNTFYPSASQKISNI